MDSFDKNFIELEIANRKSQADRNRFDQSRVKPIESYESKVNKKITQVDKEKLQQRKKAIKLLGSSSRNLFESPIGVALLGRR